MMDILFALWHSVTKGGVLVGFLFLGGDYFLILVGACGVLDCI